MSAAGNWSEVEVAGHACDVFEPANPSPHGYVVLYLHGVHLNRLTDKDAFTEQFAQRGLRVIAPMSGPSWWTDRIFSGFDAEVTAEQHLLENIVPYIAERWGTESPRIGLLGTSMGGQGALRLSFKHPNTFPVVAAISPAIDYQTLWNEEGYASIREMYTSAEAVRQDTATLHVHPLNWPRHMWFCCDPTDEGWFESADRLAMKLSSIGIMHERDLETSGGGHGFEYYSVMAPAAMEHVEQALERERLRLPIA